MYQNILPLCSEGEPLLELDGRASLKRINAHNMLDMPSQPTVMEKHHCQCGYPETCQIWIKASNCFLWPWSAEPRLLKNWMQPKPRLWISLGHLNKDSLHNEPSMGSSNCFSLCSVPRDLVLLHALRVPSLLRACLISKAFTRDRMWVSFNCDLLALAV